MFNYKYYSAEFWHYYFDEEGHLDLFYDYELGLKTSNQKHFYLYLNFIELLMLLSVLSLLLMMTINKNGCLSCYEKHYLPLIERTHLDVDASNNVEHLDKTKHLMPCKCSDNGTIHPNLSHPNPSHHRTVRLWEKIKDSTIQSIDLWKISYLVQCQPSWIQIWLIIGLVMGTC